MKKLFTLLFLLITVNSFSAPPTRVFTYSSGNVITASQNTANEDAIFNYLTAGVDTYADDTIVNADIDSAANIQSDKLNLTSVAQACKITTLPYSALFRQLSRLLIFTLFVAGS